MRDSFPIDSISVAAVLQPGEAVVRATPATARMTWGGLIAWLYAVPVFAIGWFPLRQVARHWGEAGTGLSTTAPLLLFGGFGALWVLMGVILLYQPVRLARNWPYVTHILTERRILELDRRRGVTGAIVLEDIWTLSVFAPFGRVRFRRRGPSNGSVTGRNASSPSFDGVYDVEALAQAIADRTGVPVGSSRTSVDASIARMPPGTRVR